MNTSKVAIWFLMAMLMYTVHGCTGGNDSGSPAVNTAYNLTPASFNVSSTRSLSESEFVQILNGTEEFKYDNGSTGSVDPCMNSKIGGYRFVRSGQNTYSLSIPDTEMRDCVTGGTVTIDSYVLSLYYDNIIAEDSAGNEVNLEGKTLNDVTGLKPVQFSYRTYGFIRATTSTGIAYEAESLMTDHAAAGFNDPCVNEGADGCRIESAVIFHFIDTPASDYNDKMVLESHSLGIVPGAPYYSNGTISFVFNDWSGTMTYGSDANIAPTYTASNGITNSSGTFNPLFAPAFNARGLLKPIAGRLLQGSPVKR